MSAGAIAVVRAHCVPPMPPAPVPRPGSPPAAPRPRRRRSARRATRGHPAGSTASISSSGLGSAASGLASDLGAKLGVGEELLQLVAHRAEGRERERPRRVDEVGERGRAHRQRRPGRAHAGRGQRRRARAIARRRRIAIPIGSHSVRARGDTATDRQRRRRRRRPRLGTHHGTAGERLDLADEGADVDRADEERAAVVGERVVGVLHDAAAAAEVHEVDRPRAGQLAEARELVEDALGVDVEEDDVRALGGDARREHRDRHVDDDVARAAQRVADALGLGRRVTDEDDGGRPGALPSGLLAAWPAPWPAPPACPP